MNLRNNPTLDSSPKRQYTVGVYPYPLALVRYAQGDIFELTEAIIFGFANQSFPATINSKINFLKLVEYFIEHDHEVALSRSDTAVAWFDWLEWLTGESPWPQLFNWACFHRLTHLDYEIITSIEPYNSHSFLIRTTQ